jgi:hypothetical protein
VRVQPGWLVDRRRRASRIGAGLGAGRNCLRFAPTIFRLLLTSSSEYGIGRNSI